MKPIYTSMLAVALLAAGCTKRPESKEGEQKEGDIRYRAGLARFPPVVISDGSVYLRVEDDFAGWTVDNQNPGSVTTGRVFESPEGTLRSNPGTPKVDDGDGITWRKFFSGGGYRWLLCHCPACNLSHTVHIGADTIRVQATGGRGRLRIRTSVPFVKDKQGADVIFRHPSGSAKITAVDFPAACRDTTADGLPMEVGIDFHKNE